MRQLFLLLFFIPNLLFAAPPCPEDNKKVWDECIGSASWENGKTYKGEWKNNKINGQGIMIWPGAWIYKGTFKNSRFHGKGEIVWNDGSSYIGEWNDGHHHGKGIMSWDFGIYEGEYKDG